MLEHLTASNPQTRAVPSLYHLIAGPDLSGQLETFLVTCQTDGLSPATLKYYQYQIGTFVTFCQQSNIIQPQGVTPMLIRLFLLERLKKNKASSVHDYFRAIKRFFNWLVAEGILDKSPMQGIKPPKVQREVIRPFSERDIANLLTVTSRDDFLSVRNRAILLVLLDTGIRLRELAGMHWRDVDRYHNTIIVMGKGGKERTVSIGKATARALSRYFRMRPAEPAELWLSEERHPMTRDGLQMTIKVMCRRAEITDAKCGPHTFRHTAAITCLRNGMGEFVLQIMLGHADLRMTRRYVSTLGTDDMIKAHIKASPVDNLKL